MSAQLYAIARDYQDSAARHERAGHTGAARLAADMAELTRRQARTAWVRENPTRPTDSDPDYIFTDKTVRL